MRFTEVDKGKIDALVDVGWSGRRIAIYYKWRNSSVINYVTECKKTGGFINRIYKFGHRKKISPTIDRLICRSVLGSAEKRRIFSNQISHSLASASINVSVRAVRRRLVESGLNSRFAK